MSATDGGEPEPEDEAEAEAERDPFAPEVLRALLPSEVQGKQQRVLVCALRNPDANAVQIAQKTGVASTYTVTNSLRSLLLGIAGHTGAREDITELRGGIRDAESYGELTEKQAAVVDFAALHPEYVEGHTYGDVAQAIHETDGTPVSETYVGATLRKYGTLVQQRRAWATAQGEVDADLDEVAGALTVREFLEAAGFDLPDHNLDRMPEAGPGPQATLADAQQAEADEAFQPGHQYEGEPEPEPADEPEPEPEPEPEGDSLDWLGPEWREKYGDLPGAQHAQRLPDEAGPDDVKKGPYWAYVNGTPPYGVFVSLTKPQYGDDVSGLVHRDRLYGHRSHYQRGDPLIVELDHRNPSGLAFTDWRLAHPEETQAHLEAQERAQEADDSGASEDEGEGPKREPEPADEPQEAETETEALLLPEELEDRLRDLEQGLDALRDETPRNGQVREFAEKVEARLDEVDAGTSEAHEALRSEVYDALQNSVKRDALDRVDAAEQKVDALQEMVNSLAEQVQAATTLTGLRARAQQDLQRLEAEGADVLAYSFQQQEGRITMNLQAEAQEAEDGE